MFGGGNPEVDARKLQVKNKQMQLKVDLQLQQLEKAETANKKLQGEGFKPFLFLAWAVRFRSETLFP